jgi:hypothetical protein
MWTVIISTFCGLVFGLFLAALMGAARAGDQAQELYRAYQDGYEAGQRNFTVDEWKRRHPAPEPDERACRVSFMGRKDD